MVIGTKWTKGAQPGKPVTDIARKSLRARLVVVWDCVPLAAYKAGKDIEYVHQLRVSSRRATAALQIYADLLPRKKTQSISKSLHRLRKAAGKARDLDVLAVRLAKVADQQQKTHLAVVLAEIAAERRAAQKPLVRGYVKAKQRGFKRQSRELLDKLRWRSSEPEPVFGDFARTTFRPLVSKFFEAASADLSDVKALHQMRISGKQVRYAMELLAGAFSDSFRKELYPIFGDVQEKLGTINDHATAIALYSQWSEHAHDRASQAELGELIVDERMRLDAERQRFLEWWTGDRAAELARRFDAALSDSGQPSDPTPEDTRNGRPHLFAG